MVTAPERRFGAFRYAQVRQLSRSTAPQLTIGSIRFPRSEAAVHCGLRTPALDRGELLVPTVATFVRPLLVDEATSQASVLGFVHYATSSVALA